eukprot:CAMPEP_0197495530 /NCGR_PEP_ID=MMETSP1311-20131121/37120_1 /TAXON_ID=464262 /ORGANISM="Genus nov. species nov., Strain RCC856" /LENGTH=60 /DNA_ID=CAMNT_0043041035 /DNA_START=106 /DNA_END=285 /DNA_ORIENTATION=+
MLTRFLRGQALIRSSISAAAAAQPQQLLRASTTTTPLQQHFNKFDNKQASFRRMSSEADQ